MKIKILRVVEENKLISADAFEENFKKFSSEKFIINHISSEKLNEDLLKCYKKIKQIPELLKTYDYISFGFGAFLSVPLFLTIRNKHRLNIKLLFISHAPGGHTFEFYFMQKLLRKGDIIIAPTKNAADTIKHLSPSIFDFVKIIHHPVEFNLDVANLPVLKEKFFISLSRIHPDKLLHKVIDAVYKLKEEGINIKFLIAGKLVNDSGELTTYSRILMEKVKKFNLEPNVKFLGEISDLKEKFSYLKRAVALINLSITTEESFGKSIVESICTETPVIVTKWDGFIETVGECGIFVPVNLKNGFANVDSGEIASAMKNMLENSKKFKKDCLFHSKKFKIRSIENQYFNVLSKNMESNEIFKTKENGLINRLSVIKAFNFKEIFKFYLEYFEKNIVEKSKTITNGCILHQILNLSVTKSIRYLLAGDYFKDEYFTIDTKCNISKKDFYYSLLNSVFLNSTEFSKELSLFFTLGKVDIDYYADILEKAYKFFNNKRNINYLKIEVEILKENYNNAEKLWTSFFKEREFDENDYILIRQIAKIYRRLKQSEKSIPIINSWLEKFNFSTNSLPVWADLCYNAIEAGDGFVHEAEKALNMVNILSEDREFAKKLEKKFIGRLI